LSTVTNFESLVDQGLALPIDKQAEYINQVFTGQFFRALQNDEVKNCISFKKMIQLIGPHLVSVPSNKRFHFLAAAASYALEKSDFEKILTNLPRFKIIAGDIIRSAYDQYGIEFAVTMAKTVRSREVVVKGLYELFIDIDESDRDTLFLELPEFIRLPHRIKSLSPDEVKRGVYKTERHLLIKNEILKILESGRQFNQLLREIEDGSYLPDFHKDFLFKTLLSISRNQAENCLLTLNFGIRLKISSSELSWVQLVKECTMFDDTSASTWKDLFILLYQRDSSELQNWFETLRSAYPESYWKLFRFKGIDGESNSIALFRALAQHLCYGENENYFSTSSESNQNLHKLTKKLWTNCSKFVQDGKHEVSYSLVIMFVSCFARFGDTQMVEQLGNQIVLRDDQMKSLNSHDGYLVELCVSHCKSSELDIAFQIYKELPTDSDFSFKYMEFLISDLARSLSAQDVSIFVFNRHLAERRCFDPRTLTVLLRSPGIFDTYRYKSVSIYKDLLAMGQEFDMRQMFVFAEAVRYRCGLGELEDLASEVSVSRPSISSEVLGQLMFCYLDVDRTDDALKVFQKIAVIDGHQTASYKFGSLLATYKNPIVDSVVLQFDK
jgi:hypothetical protein